MRSLRTNGGASRLWSLRILPLCSLHLNNIFRWDSLVTHLEAVPSDASLKPPVSREEFIERSSFEQLESKFAATIEESTIVRLNNVISPDLADPHCPIFSNEVRLYAETHLGLGAKHNPLSKDHQRLEYWRRQLKSESDDLAYVQLADAVKTLITIAAVAQLDPKTADIAGSALGGLLSLTLDPENTTLIQKLRQMRSGDCFGIDQLPRSTCKIYTQLHLLEASHGEMYNGPLTALTSPRLKRLLAEEGLGDNDYSTQNILHRYFWQRIGVTAEMIGTDVSRNRKSTCQNTIMTAIQNIGRDKKTELALYNSYLENCFAILAVYNILLNSWGNAKSASQFWKECLKESVTVHENASQCTIRNRKRVLGRYQQHRMNKAARDNLDIGPRRLGRLRTRHLCTEQEIRSKI